MFCVPQPTGVHKKPFVCHFQDRQPYWPIDSFRFFGTNIHPWQPIFLPIFLTPRIRHTLECCWHKGRSQAGPKGRQPKVGAQRLLCSLDLSFSALPPPIIVSITEASSRQASLSSSRPHDPFSPRAPLATTISQTSYCRSLILKDISVKYNQDISIYRATYLCTISHGIYHFLQTLLLTNFLFSVWMSV